MGLGGGQSYDRSRDDSKELGPEHVDTPASVPAVRIRDPFRCREAAGGVSQAIKVPHRAARDGVLSSLEYRPLNNLSAVGTAEGGSGLLLSASRSAASLDDIFSQDRQQSLDRLRRPSLERLGGAREPLSLQRPSTPEPKAAKAGEGTVVSSSSDGEPGDSFKRTASEKDGDSIAKLNSSTISKYLQSLPRAQSKVRAVSSRSSSPSPLAGSSPKRALRETPNVEIIHSVEAQGGSATGSPCSRGVRLRLSMLQVGSHVFCPSEPVSTLTVSVDPGDAFLRFTLRHQGKPGKVETSYITRLSVERIWVCGWEAAMHQLIPCYDLGLLFRGALVR